VGAGGAADGLDQLGVGRLLEDVRGRARGERAARELRIVLHGEDHHACGGDLRGEGGERLEARRHRPGHVEVQHQHGGAVGDGLAERVVDRAGLGDDLQVRLGVEHEPQPAAHDRVVVGEDDGDRAGGLHGARS
jgi:hypothetical protein